LDAVAAEIAKIQPTTTLEFGCGEGYFFRHLSERGAPFGHFVGIDLRDDAIAHANAETSGANFRCVDLFEWPPTDRFFDLVIAAEVLEHLPDPAPYLERLVQLSADRLLLTVPHEPWFMLSNLLRVRDILRFGDHPEHVNHWTPKSFSCFVSRFASVERVVTRFPFVILVARARQPNKVSG